MPRNLSSVIGSRSRVLLATCLVCSVVCSVDAQMPTTFTYHGSVPSSGGAQANSAVSMEFKLFDAPSGGAQVGATIRQNVHITNSLFTAQLDFGANAFPGGPRYLEVTVDGATLTPRQRVAGNDPRASMPNPVGGTISGNILDAATQFNFAGERVLTLLGTPLQLSSLFIGPAAGGNETTLLGQGRLSTFVGVNTGHDNQTGLENTFAGWDSGYVNTTGSYNTYVGVQSGFNANGSFNAFFGAAAGLNLQNNSSENSFFGTNAGSYGHGGSDNTFVGFYAGFPNSLQAAQSMGTNNTLLGANASLAAENLTYATAIGANAVATQSNTLVLGAINGVGGATADTKVGIGTSTPTARLEVVGNLKVSGIGNGISFPDGTTQTTAAAGGGGVASLNALTGAVTLAEGANISITPSGNTLTIASTGGSGNSILNQTSQQTGANFNIDGTGTADRFNALTQYNLGGSKLISNPGQDNLFVGIGAEGVTPSLANDIIENTFFGFEAGQHNLDCCNAFFGNYSGQNNTTGGGNAFFGYQAGIGSTTASYNTFVGTNAGFSHHTGDYNTSIGNQAGGADTNGSNNTFIGASATIANGSSGLSFASAIGAGAQVSTSNTVVIGRAADTVSIPGTLTKAAGSFKIDHPLDPANMTLSHSFVESPDMMNIYNGNVTTGADGAAVVELPAYFEALNRDFRYQLTVIGTFAQAIVASEIADNRFTIRTDKPNVKVSWQVTGIRHDAYASDHRIPVEEQKPAGQRGTYLYPVTPYR